MLCFKSHTGKKIHFCGENYSIGVESDELRIASNQNITFYTEGYGGIERAKLFSDGTFSVPNKINTSSVYNNAGILKLQAGASDNVELFGDTDVGNAENGKILYIRRQAAEGNDYIRIYVSSGRTSFIHSDRDLTLQGQIDFTINSVTQNVIFKVGDNSGAKKFYFKDSDGIDISSIDSNGHAWFAGNVGIGTNAPGLPLEVRSADDNQAMFFDSTSQAQGVGGGIAFGGKYTDAGLEAMAGRIGVQKTNNTSGNVGFDLVIQTQNSVGSITNRIKILSDGKVGINNIIPTKVLDVNGDSRIRGDLTIDDTLDVTGNMKPFHFGNVTEDKISLFEDRLGGTGMYGFGVESNALYSKAPINHRWYIGVNADGGVNSKMNLTATGLGLGTSTPHDNFHIVDASPSFILEESDANNSEKVWELTATGGMLKLLAQSDLYTATQIVFEIDRGGTSPTKFCFPNSKIGIKTSNPTSNLQVTGLSIYNNNADAISNGLTVGAFYRNGADTDKVCVVH